MCVLGACRPEPSTKTSLYYGKFFSAWSTRRAQSKQKKRAHLPGFPCRARRGDKKKALKSGLFQFCTMEFHHRRKQERLTMGEGEGRIAVVVRRSKIWFLGRGGGVYFLYAVITSPSFNRVQFVCPTTSSFEIRHGAVFTPP